MNRMEFDVLCPLCGGDLEFVARTAPSPRRQGAVVRCGTCKRDMVIAVELVLTFKPDPGECGSMAGYNRHLRRNEDQCEPCISARNEYERERRRNRKLANA